MDQDFKVQELENIKNELITIKIELENATEVTDLMILVENLEYTLNKISNTSGLNPEDKLTIPTSSAKEIIYAKASLTMQWKKEQILPLCFSGKGDKSQHGLGLSIHNLMLADSSKNKYSKIAVMAVDGVYFYKYEIGMPAKYIDIAPYSKQEEGALKFRLLNEFTGQDISNEDFELPPNIKPETLVDKWAELMFQEYDQETSDKLKEFGGFASIQHIDEAVGADVNLDFFSVQIDKLPNGMSANDFFELFRTDINGFIDKNIANFEPYNKKETKNWNSEEYDNTVVHIDMAIEGVFNKWFNPEDGSVIVTKQENLKWVFTTIYVFQDGRHPVSGNREFGLQQNNDGTYTFYTAGVDRTTGVDDAQVNYWTNKIFSGADKLWNSMQVKVENYIDNHGGQAHDNPDITVRPNYENAKKILN